MTPHLTPQLPIEPLDQIDLTRHQNMGGLLAVAAAVAAVVAEAVEEEAGDGLELPDLEQVPHRFHFQEATGRCMETPPGCSKATRPRQGHSLESGIDTGVLTTSQTLCVFPTLAANV